MPTAKLAKAIGRGGKAFHGLLQRRTMQAHCEGAL